MVPPLSLTQAGVSVSIITRNEESSLKRCLDSVSWSGDIVVLDSYSTDLTESIANGFPGVRFLQRKFDDYSSQRNHALHEVDYHNSWVFIIDADEVCPADLKEEILRTAASADQEAVVFHMRRKDFFLDRWMRHTTMYPVWFERLVRPKRVRYTGIFNEHLAWEGKEGFLKHHLHHFPFDKGLAFWIDRHNRYSTLQAQENIEKSRDPLVLRALFCRNPLQRRAEMKKLYAKIPSKWFLYLLYNFFVKGCFLDGIKGIKFVLLRSYYEYMVDLKTTFGRQI